MYSDGVRHGLMRAISKNEDRMKRDKNPYSSPSSKIRAD
jgi:hypothetical protein